MPSSSLLRLGGLAALVGGGLVVIFELVGLVSSLLETDPFGSNEYTRYLFYILSVLSLFGEALIMLGLVGLYVRQLQSVGIIGLVAFLLAFFGMALGVGAEDINWAAGSAAYLGWALFGVVSLRSRVYPRVASILLCISALLAGAFNPLYVLLVVGPPGSRGSDLIFAGLAGSIVVNMIVAWLGFTLFFVSEREPRLRSSN